MIVVIIIYVDDILITGNKKSSILQICEKIKQKYRIKELGFPHKFLWFEIEKRNEGIFASQKLYITNLLKEHIMSDSHPKDTLMLGTDWKSQSYYE